MNIRDPQPSWQGAGKLEALFESHMRRMLTPWVSRFHLRLGQPLASVSQPASSWDPYLGLMRCGRSGPGRSVQPVAARDRARPAPSAPGLSVQHGYRTDETCAGARSAVPFRLGGRRPRGQDSGRDTGGRKDRTWYLYFGTIPPDWFTEIDDLRA